MLQTLVSSLSSGAIPLLDHVASVLESVETVEPRVLAFLPEPGRRERVLRAAEHLLKRYPKPSKRPPLFGVLVGVKDLFNVDGLPTRAGSKLPPEAFQGAQAGLVSRLVDAGAIVLGKTVSTEFAYFAPGPTRNPINPDHTPGGSSSGSAAAVAARICPLALGTQTIASITRPAAYCGVYGFKPSRGRMPLDGGFPFSPAVDQAGYFCASLADIEYCAPLLVDGWKSPPNTPRPVLGCVTGTYLEQAVPEAREAFLSGIHSLRERGFKVLEVDLFPDIEAINSSHKALTAWEFAQVHRELFARYGKLYAPQSAELVQEGLRVPTDRIPSLREQMNSLRVRIESAAALHGIGIWISPAATMPAPLGLASTGSPLMSLPWTNAGLPTLCVPSSIAANGLPLGLQFAASSGRDEYLLRAASLLPL